MKNKKKNWRRILLRGSALMAAVLMCFAGSFPAFAAVDPAEPGGSVTLIKAGTYRFNDVLTEPSEWLQENINFVCDSNNYESFGRVYDETLSFFFGYGSDVVAYVTGENMIDFLNTSYGLSVFEGWQDEAYKTIIIPTDQDVSVEFAEWFRNNTVLVSPLSNVLEGEWTLKPFVSVPDASYSLAIDYTVSGDLKVSSDVSVPIIGSCSSLFVIVGDAYVVRVGGLCVASDPSISELDPSLTYPIDVGFYREFNNGEISYGGFSSPVTFDFGDGVVFDDPAFYQWFTSNAIPHREMWTLTDRLQAVAASIWSVIVTISSTIVSNPLLLFTSGFLFLGGCIALFSRLLARR